MRAASRCISIVLLLVSLSPLSACLNDRQAVGLMSLGSFPKGIAFDNEDNAYIATVTGDIIRYDGRQLTRFIPRGTHGLDFAEKIRFAQDKLYIHNKRYVESEQVYVNEILLFSISGEYIDLLLSEDEAKTSQIYDIVVNHTGQLYSIINIQEVLRVNFDKQDLIKITPLINIDALTQKILDVLKQFEDIDIPGIEFESLSLPTPLADKIAAETTETGELDISELTSDLNKLTVTEDAVRDALANTTKIAEVVQLTLPLLGLSNITIDVSDHVYMSCLFGVFMFDSDGNYLKSITTVNDNDISLTHSLAADPYGNMVIASYDPAHAADMQFNRFDRDGNHTGKLLTDDTTGMWTSIQDIAFDSAGNFYVVDFVKGVHKFNQNGQFEKIIARPFD